MLECFITFVLNTAEVARDLADLDSLSPSVLPSIAADLVAAFSNARAELRVHSLACKMHNVCVPDQPFMDRLLAVLDDLSSWPSRLLHACLVHGALQAPSNDAEGTSVTHHHHHHHHNHHLPPQQCQKGLLQLMMLPRHMPTSGMLWCDACVLRFHHTQSQRCSSNGVKLQCGGDRSIGVQETAIKAATTISKTEQNTVRALRGVCSCQCAMLCLSCDFDAGCVAVIASTAVTPICTRCPH